MLIGTFGVFWYQNYDERTYYTPVMCGKIQRNKEYMMTNFTGVFIPRRLFALPVHYLARYSRHAWSLFGAQYRLKPPFRHKEAAKVSYSAKISFIFRGKGVSVCPFKKWVNPIEKVLYSILPDKSFIASHLIAVTN